jgi:hypothetical protein
MAPTPAVAPRPHEARLSDALVELLGARASGAIAACDDADKTAVVAPKPTRASRSSRSPLHGRAPMSHQHRRGAAPRDGRPMLNRLYSG